jgi:hypothetical protein
MGPKWAEYGSTSSIRMETSRTFSNNPLESSPIEVALCTKPMTQSTYASPTKSHMSVLSPKANLKLVTPIRPWVVKEKGDPQPILVASPRHAFSQQKRQIGGEPPSKKRKLLGKLVQNLINDEHAIGEVISSTFVFCNFSIQITSICCNLDM